MSEVRRTPLGTRFVATALAGAAVVAVVAALLAVPLVRSVARDQSRSELVRAVDTLAKAPRRTAQLLVQERRAVGPDDRLYAVVPASGPVVGEAADVVTAAQVARLRDTGTLSASVDHDGEELIVEGRQVGQRGVAVVGVQPVAAVDAATNHLLWRIGLALAAGLAVALGLGLLIGRRATRSVRDAAQRAHRLAGGERGIAPASSSITEIHEMSQALAALDQALATSEARQREFLLSISHELRTPLTALHGYAEALRDSAIPPEQTAKVGATLTAETERLDQFIGDLLALARLEADDFRLQETGVDLADVLTQTAAAWEATARAHDLTLVVEASASAEPFRGDALRIRQLLDGLVENAMRATPAGGQVTLRADRDATGADLTVSDTGPGLAPGEHERAFERGYLRDRYAEQRGVGTGLGLSIAHRLCERMGGTLTAAPNEPAGTRMTVHLRRDGP
ncbi:two-component system, OmpR family, sensor kinase [Marmoricola sp. URHA0025 HA25]